MHRNMIGPITLELVMRFVDAGMDGVSLELNRPMRRLRALLFGCVRGNSA